MERGFTQAATECRELRQDLTRLEDRMDHSFVKAAAERLSHAARVWTVEGIGSRTILPRPRGRDLRAPSEARIRRHELGSRPPPRRSPGRYNFRSRLPGSAGSRPTMGRPNTRQPAAYCASARSLLDGRTLRCRACRQTRSSAAASWVEGSACSRGSGMATPHARRCQTVRSGHRPRWDSGSRKLGRSSRPDVTAPWASLCLALHHVIL